MTSELPLLQAIGQAAGQRFAEVGLDDVAADPPHELAALEAWRAAGRAWVSTDREGHPVGFVVVDLVDEAAHVEEVSVRPDHHGHGHGLRLMRHVEAWARSRGLPAVTLTTFRDVAWNRPWYERRGYRVLPEEEWTPGLVARRQEEAEAGLDPDARVVMAKALDPEPDR
jgi:GNAT superfamily N-acetyltransferase